MKKLIWFVLAALLAVNVPLAAAQSPNQSISPEELRGVLLKFVDTQERMNESNASLSGAIADTDLAGLRQRYEALSEEELGQMLQVFPDVQAFAAQVAQLDAITFSQAMPVGQGSEPDSVTLGPPAKLAPALFTPAYPTGPNYDAFTATLAGFGLLYDGPDPGSATNDERCDSNGEAGQQIALATEKVVCELLYIAADAAPADFLSVAVRAGLFAGVAACTAVTVATEITIMQCDLQDGLVDGAEIEAAYENSKIVSGQVADVSSQLALHDAGITSLVNTTTTSVLNQVSSTENNLSSQLTQHDTDLKGALSTHDTDVKTALSTHDTDVKTALSTHDTEVKSALSTHDTDVKTALSIHDTDVKTALSTHDTEMKSALSTHDAQIKSALATHDTEIKAKLDALSAQLGAFQDQALQIEIEKALADTNDSTPVSYFYLPAAYGGLLEVVRDTVESAIVNNEVAGIAVDNAWTWFDEAQDDFASGLFKDAYDNYGKAYRSLVK
jgi:hypothetical protein